MTENDPKQGDRNLHRRLVVDYQETELSKAHDEPKTIDVEVASKNETEEPTPHSRGGGWVFPAIIMLVIAAWCAYDGFYKMVPGEKYKLFNQIAAVVLGLGGIGLLVWEGMRPRGTEQHSRDQADTEKKE